jgi:hypothetical protein
VARGPLPAALGPRLLAGRTSCFRFAVDNVTQQLELSLDLVRAAAVGPEWFVQQAMGYLARPKPSLHQLTATLRRTLELPPEADGGYAAVHVRHGDKSSEALQHPLEEYASALRAASVGASWRHVLLSSDERSSYDKLPLLLPELRFTWVPHKYFLVSPGSLGRTVAAKHVQANYELGGRLHQHANSPAGGRRQSAAEQELGTSFDEGMLLMATAELIAGARAVVGTLTSNFGLLLHDLAARQHNGTSSFFDLDNNNYYSCSVRVEPPWGPLRGRPRAVQDRLAEAYRRAVSL